MSDFRKLDGLIKELSKDPLSLALPVLSGDFETSKQVVEKAFIKQKIKEVEGYKEARDSTIKNLREFNKFKKIMDEQKELFDIKEEELEDG